MIRGRVTTMLAGVAAIAVAAMAVPAPAQAYWRHGWGGGWGGGGWGGGGWGCCGGVGIGLGFGFAPPAYYGPPAYYPPPVYSAPPVYYAPPPPTYYYSQPAPEGADSSAGEAPPAVAAPAPYGTQSGSLCYAGPYVCPLDRAQPAGSDCSCPGSAGSGRVNGRSG